MDKNKMIKKVKEIAKAMSWAEMHKKPEDFWALRKKINELMEMIERDQDEHEQS